MSHRLEREAELLNQLQPAARAWPSLPRLLPAYTRANTQARLVGRAMLAGQLVSYILMEHVPGEPLQDVLKKHPQLWIDHIGWITIELASAVALVHGANHLHLALGPECVLVHFAGDQGIPRVTLVDVGLATPWRESVDGRPYARHWYARAVRPASTAPELVAPTVVSDGVSASTQTDVYGLGVVLYELLAGAPPFPRDQVAVRPIYERVAAGQLTPLRRADVPPIADLTLRMLAREPAARPPDARAIVNEIKGTEIGTAPVVRPSRWPAPERIFRIAAAVLLVAFVIALALSLRELLV